MAVDKSIIGKAGKPFTMPIEWGKVREFARAVKDPNPVYFDPELAKKECGGVPIPVTFLQTSAFWQTAESMPSLDMFDMRRILHGEQEFEFFNPILVGDTLTGVARVADLYEKEGGLRAGRNRPGGERLSELALRVINGLTRGFSRAVRRLWHPR
jgi:acyl dehydratase